jgi:hypothetical protein
MPHDAASGRRESINRRDTSASLIAQWRDRTISRRRAVWWDCRGSFPRPFTIYAGNVEDVSLGVGDFARALTNSERRNQRRRERALRRSGIEAGSAGRTRRAQTERRTETRSSTKDYADAQDDAVNQRARKSVEENSLAVAVGTVIADRPPRRSVRALLRIRLPPRMTSGNSRRPLRPS